MGRLARMRVSSVIARVALSCAHKSHQYEGRQLCQVIGREKGMGRVANLGDVQVAAHKDLLARQILLCEV